MERQDACDVCAEFDKGPILTRAALSEIIGRDLDPAPWAPWQRAVELDDGWVILWGGDRRDDAYLCPFHGHGLEVPRENTSMKIGTATIDLREFDFIGIRNHDIAMFKHITSRRYLNMQTMPPHDAVEYHEGRLESIPYSAALRRARESRS